MISFEPGMIAILIGFAIFYLRLMQLRSRKRRQEREELLANIKKGAGKSKKINLPNPQPQGQPTFKITSWWLVAAGMVLMCLGVILYTTTWFPPEINQFWWLVVTLGIVPFFFAFTV